MKTVLRNSLMILFMLTAVVLPGQSLATVATDIQDLADEATVLQSHLAGLQLTEDSLCAPLVNANQATRILLENIEIISNGLTAPVTIDDSVMTALENLSLANVQMGDQALRLAMDIQYLEPSLDGLSIKDGLVAMLQLSDDIGSMADRIGEMADKILVMADNIGLMADRILLTQQIQSQNLVLTQETLLQTQSNILTLVSAIETETYDLDLNTLIVEGELLAANLAATVFSPFTIKYQLENAAADVKDFKAQVQAMTESIKTAGATNTMIVNDSTLLALTNMAIMASSVATVLDGYNLALESMVSMLSDRNLSASLSSMLEMSADIGVMANSILEMADLILVMSDNIGLAADQIILTQEMQSGYLAISQASILATQEMVIAMIVAESL